ncbi:MAG: glycosyltransferase family 2 protein [Caulobacteraceae bacterium]
MGDRPPDYTVFVTPWAGLAEQELACASRTKAQSLVEVIDQELSWLEPRLDQLEELLDPSTRSNKHYRRSKKWLPARVSLRAERRRLSRQPPALAYGHGAQWGQAPPEVQGSLQRARTVLIVGATKPSGPAAEMAASAQELIRVTPAEGAPRQAFWRSEGRYRPAENSLADWLAMSSEQDRSRIDVFVLGYDVGLTDLALLRHRLPHRAHIVTEHGSLAAAWLAIQWDGERVSLPEGAIWRAPGPLFREPSRLMCLPERNWPKISVVTVSHNQREFLEECVRSIVEQNYPNLEYIVIDACSTDGSVDLLRHYRDCIDQLVIEPDNGQSDGLCKGFSRATGDLLTWINSDDALAPNALRRVALAFMDHGAGIVAGTCERIGERPGEFLGRHYSAFATEQLLPFSIDAPIRWADSWERGDFFFQPELFFSRDIWRRSGAGLKHHLHWAMDWDLWLRMAAAGANIVRIPDVLGVSRVQAQQKTTSAELYLPQVAGILREHQYVYARLAAEWDFLVEQAERRASDDVERHFHV